MNLLASEIVLHLGKLIYLMKIVIIQGFSSVYVFSIQVYDNIIVSGIPKSYYVLFEANYFISGNKSRNRRKYKASF